MKPEQYEATKNQLLLIGSMVHLTPLEDLVQFIEFLERAQQIGVVDEKEWKEVRGDTDLLLFIARRLLDIKTVLPTKKG